MCLTRPYGNAATREARRFRVLGMIRGGARYDEIAAAEGISRERVRQIVIRSLERDDFDKDEHRRVQAARLEPALKLALDAIAEGRIEAIDRLIRVLAAQDKYLAAHAFPLQWRGRPRAAPARAQAGGPAPVAGNRSQDERPRHH